MKKKWNENKIENYFDNKKEKDETKEDEEQS